MAEQTKGDKYLGCVKLVARVFSPVVKITREFFRLSAEGVGVDLLNVV